jgi:hypothetical protein
MTARLERACALRDSEDAAMEFCVPVSLRKCSTCAQSS